MDVSRLDLTYWLKLSRFGILSVGHLFLIEAKTFTSKKVSVLKKSYNGVLATQYGLLKNPVTIWRGWILIVLLF